MLSEFGLTSYDSVWLNALSMGNSMFDARTFVMPGFERDDGNWSADSSKQIVMIKQNHPELSEWGDLAIGCAWLNYSDFFCATAFTGRNTVIGISVFLKKSFRNTKDGNLLKRRNRIKRNLRFRIQLVAYSPFHCTVYP